MSDPGLIIRNIAQWGTMVEEKQLDITMLQNELAQVTESSIDNPKSVEAAKRKLLAKLTAAQMLYNLAKTFYDFWIKVFEDFINFIKKNQELGFSGGR